MRCVTLTMTLPYGRPVALRHYVRDANSVRRWVVDALHSFAARRGVGVRAVDYSLTWGN